MANSYFRFKQFTIHQDCCAMKVTTDACLFGAWATREVRRLRSKARHVLDIGTGTGLLSLMLTQQTDTTIDAVEIDEEAAKQAKANIEASSWKEKISVINGDVKELVFDKTYDVIISNPPFYENGLASPDNKKNIAHHHEGLLFPDLLQVISKNLATDGSFFLLLPFKRMQEAESSLKKAGLAISHITLVKQSTQHGYFRVFISGVHAAHNEKKYAEDELAIWNDQQQYTNEFIELLKDYYLYL